MFVPGKRIAVGLTFFMIALFVLFFDSCRRDAEIIPAVAPDDVTFKIPPGFPAPVYNFENNPVTVDGFKLGRRLFYEGRLASDNSISCGFCHQQVNAFANSGHQFSHGVGGLFGTRNAPPVFNLAWNYTFMWDGGINHIENQPLGPIANPVEMNESLANVIAKLNADLSYKDQFKAAFGDDSVTTQRLCRALAQFMGIMISAESKYDQYMRGDAAFTTQESNGLALFRTKCASCHTEPLFSDRSYHNNGLPVDPTINDRGRMMITNDAADSLKFKTPSLRNCAVTYPYMHDGRFMTLSECLNHYAGGVVISPTLDPLLAAGIPLTTQEKSDLLAFLATLTDQKFLTDTRFREQ